MKIFLTVIGIVLCLVVLFQIKKQIFGFDEIEWRGESFKLSCKFGSWEEYKKSFDQLHQSELDRVANLMNSVELRKEYSDHLSFIQEFKLQSLTSFFTRAALRDY